MPIELSSRDPLLGLAREAWERAAATVALLGSRPRAACCQVCAQRAGRLYARDDRRVLCWLAGGGPHPRCRHWLVAAAPRDARPVEEIGSPALATAARLAREGKTAELRRLLAKTTRALLGGKSVRLHEISIGLEP